MLHLYGMVAVEPLWLSMSHRAMPAWRLKYGITVSRARLVNTEAMS